MTKQSISNKQNRDTAYTLFGISIIAMPISMLGILWAGLWTIEAYEHGVISVTHIVVLVVSLIIFSVSSIIYIATSDDLYE